MENIKKVKPKKYTFKSLPRLLDLIEPTSKAKEYCQKLIDTLVKEGYTTDAKIVGECLKKMNGEDIPMSIMDEKHGVQKSNGKTESKFMVGDWVVLEDSLSTYKIVEVCKPWYEVISNNDGMQYSIGFDEEDDCRLWTIYDAKKGDILQANKCTLIFDSLAKDIDGNTVISSWYYCNTKTFYGMGTYKPDLWVIEGVTPATKEQRDFLFAKMKEAGYEWDNDKKELMKKD